MTSPQWGSASGPHAQLEGTLQGDPQEGPAVYRKMPSCCYRTGLQQLGVVIQCLSSSLGWWFGWHFMLQKKLKTVLASAASYTNLFPHPMRMES